MAEFNQDSGDSAYISGVFELSIHDSDLTLTDSTFYNSIQAKSIDIVDSANVGRLGSFLSDTRWL